MNYFALAPNAPLPAQQLPQTRPTHAPTPPALILRMISVALTTSLNNYQNSLVSIPTTAQSTIQKENVPKDHVIVQEPLQTPTQPSAQPRMAVRTQNKNVPKQSCAPTVRGQPTKPKTNHHLSTSEELADERADKPVQLREERTRKKSTAEVTKAEVGSQPISRPVVDLIEAAYLPELGLGREELSEMRSRLQSRRVDEWNDKLRFRQDKRELRLLGC